MLGTAFEEPRAPTATLLRAPPATSRAMKRARDDASTSSSSSSSNEDIAALIASAKPSVVIFDLDSTLWNGNVEDGFRVVGPGEAVGEGGRTLRLFPDVDSIFRIFNEHGVPIGIASASPATATATRLLRGFGLQYGHAHISPGKKDVHLKEIRKALGVNLSRAVFFDDLNHNLKTAISLGVTCVLVDGRTGLSMADVKKGLQRLKDNSRGSAMMRAFLQPKPAPAAAPPPPPPPPPDAPPSPPDNDASATQSCFVKYRLQLALLVLLLMLLIAFIVDQSRKPCSNDQACLNRGFDVLTAWLADNVVAGSIVLTLVLTLCAMCLVPASALTLASGAAFARALGLGYGVLVGSLVVFIGFSIGALLAFLVARHLLKELAQRQLHRWRITSAIDKAMEHEGLKVMVLLRLSPLIPYNVLNYIIAATSVTLRDYTVALGAMLPGVIAYVYLGGAVADAAASASGADEQPESARVVQTILVVVGAVASLAAVVMISVFARRHLTRNVLSPSGIEAEMVGAAPV